MANWIKANRGDISFEDTSVGRLKKKIWDASDTEIDQILAEYGIPTPSELAKPGTYIQTTVRKHVVENRKKNDILFIPIGCTELHGVHTVTALDTFEERHTGQPHLDTAEFRRPSSSPRRDARHDPPGGRSAEENVDRRDGRLLERRLQKNSPD